MKSGSEANEVISLYLSKPSPCMIARFGDTELEATVRYAFSKRRDFPVKLLPKSFFWNYHIKFAMCNNAGFFPPTEDALERFGELMISCIPQIDVLGSWLRDEVVFQSSLKSAQIIPKNDLEPFRHSKPWTSMLAGMTVLVVHPFSKTIASQYKKRDNLFESRQILPEFNLKTLTAVQSIARNKTQFNTWFDAYKWMCTEICCIEFDVAIIGAGAYGLPLAAFVKQIGKKAIHLGGVTQLLFGIKGKRWDSNPFYESLYNEHWTRPLAEETPKAHHMVEGGCYW